ncbi:MAG: hypothetical protein DCF22_13550 [Leptolyngbya sp.]|nr:MAG: hypothetical protein DCF22_13550 [Leptolyngbya sp.]
MYCPHESPFSLGSSVSLEELVTKSISQFNIDSKQELIDSISVNLFGSSSSLIGADTIDLSPVKHVSDLFDYALTRLKGLGQTAIAPALQAAIITELNNQQDNAFQRSLRPTLLIDPVDRNPPIIAPIAPPIAPIPVSLVTLSNLLFSGKEGDTGTFQLKLNLEQAPTSNITLALTSGNFLVVDADNNLQNGTQNFVTFTPQTWNQIQTVWFIAEVDGIGTDRAIGNTIDYQLSGEAVASGTYDLGSITNTYAPDTSRFNIDLDFRNDTSGFWTLERRAIAQQASMDWSSRIANEWTGLQLNGTINKLQTGSTTTAFQTRRYVDDLVVFVNTIDSNGTAGGYGGIEYDYGGWITSADLMPRVGQIAIDEAVSNTYLYNAVSHELGHTLGLLGLNWAGYLQQDFTNPQTAVFQGEYSKALNGGQDIPLQSQDGANPVTGQYDYWHPAARVSSILSYQWLYYLPGPTEMDFAMLADSGYRIYGINAPLPPVVVPVASMPLEIPTNLTRPVPVVVASAESVVAQEEQPSHLINTVVQESNESTQELASVL